MKVIGLTGSFGTGKTSVAAIFKSLGAKVIDADKIARGFLKKGTAVYRDIVREFGMSVIAPGGNVDRKKLAKVIFSDEKKRAALESIIHPQVIRSIKASIAKSKNADVVVIDAPLLIEAGLSGAADLIVVVKASRSRQIERCIKKFGMEKRDVERRIACEIPSNKKTSMADFVIDNNGTMAETRKKTMKVWTKIWK